MGGLALIRFDVFILWLAALVDLLRPIRTVDHKVAWECSAISGASLLSAVESML